jgi:hypothetical protein
MRGGADGPKLDGRSAVVVLLADCRERRELRVESARFLRKGAREQLVEGLDDSPDASEVGRERQDAPAAFFDPAGGGLEGGDVGAAKAVDRLLRVADDKELSRRLGRARLGSEREEDFVLDRVRVLHLVDQDVVEASRFLPADGWVVAEEVA